MHRPTTGRPRVLPGAAGSLGLRLRLAGQADRAPGQPTFAGGLSLVYTDQAHGYGNAGTVDPPAHTVLDSQPQPGNNAPNLDDAARTAAVGDNAFSDAGAGWTDNYVDPGSDDQQWHFRWDCLSFEVLSMSGDGKGPPTARAT